MRKIFFRGLIAITPLALTLALIGWLFAFLENFFGGMIKAIFGDQYYFRGLGILVALVFIFFIGILVNHWVIKKLYDYGDRILKKIPLFKSIYTSIKDLMTFFHGDSKLKQSHVVAIEIAGTRLIGFVTRSVFSDLPSGIGDDEDVAVYLPMSYQIGGYTIIIPKSQIKKIHMSFEESMRFVISAGILGSKN